MYLLTCFCYDRTAEDNVISLYNALHEETLPEGTSRMDAGRAYEQLVPDRGRYRKKRIALPYPEFYTFYNGKEKYIKETMLRLSDSYKQDRNSEAMLELIVRVININLEEQHEI